MNVLLIFPEAEHIKEFMAERPPLGLAYIAAFLEQNGHKIKILDLNLEENTKEELSKNLKECDMVGISVLSVLYKSSKKLISEIREINKEIPIIVGGAHVTALPKLMMEENDINFVIIGEGEEAFLELINESKSNKNYENIKGIFFRKDGEIKQTSPREPIQDLDKLPFPARHLLKMDRYVNRIDNEKVTVIMSSRGCPFHCFYCVKNIYPKWRGRSAKNVVDEIEHVYKEYGAKVIYFCDDLFTFNKQRTIDICKSILERNIKIRWLCTSRVDTIDEEMLSWMKKAGCYSIQYGVESGDQGIIDKMGKGITLEKAKKAFKLTKKAKMYSKAYFIIGFPWDTEETVNKTIKFALSLGTDELQFTMLMPFPGTPCWYEAIKVGSIDPRDIDWDVFSPTNLEIKDKVFFTNNISEERMRQLRRKAYKKAVIYMVWQKLKKGNIMYLYKFIKEKRNLGLFKFLKNIFLKK